MLLHTSIYNTTLEDVSNSGVHYTILRKSPETSDGVGPDIGVLIGVVQELQGIFRLERSPCQQHRLQLEGEEVVVAK